MCVYKYCQTSLNKRDMFRKMQSCESIVAGISQIIFNKGNSNTTRNIA